MYPEYPPGSSGNRSALPLLAVEQSAFPAAQWMPIPTKSANACPGFDATSAACGELGPNTVGMSVAMFSSVTFAVPTPPKLQPALVYGTHGAGAFRPFAASILNVVSVGVDVVGSKIGSVQ